MKTRDAFTLIELLVVIAIITVLASLLLPALSRARRMAKDALCTGYLKQIAIGFTTYASDHDGQVPYDINWSTPGKPNFGEFRSQQKPEFGAKFSAAFGEELLSHVDREIVSCPFHARDDIADPDWQFANGAGGGVYVRYLFFIGLFDLSYPEKNGVQHVFPDHVTIGPASSTAMSNRCTIPGERLMGDYPYMPIASDAMGSDAASFSRSHPGEQLDFGAQPTEAITNLYVHGDPDHNFAFPDGSVHGTGQLQGPYYFGLPNTHDNARRFVLFQQ